MADGTPIETSDNLAYLVQGLVQGGGGSGFFVRIIGIATQFVPVPEDVLPLSPGTA